MRGADRVHIAVERSDGARIARVPFPRWLVSVVVALAGTTLVVAGAWYADYSALKKQRAEFAALQARLAEQQKMIEGFQARVGQVRTEVDTWRDLHARIWQPFGPDGGPTPRGTGVGGTALRLFEAPRASGSILDEMERLAAVVAEEGENLRALERFIGKAGRVLASLPSRWPVRGPVNSDFGRRPSPWSPEAAELHGGLDIGAPRGTPVIAPAPGTVIFAGRHAEYGVTLVVDHGNDIKTVYGHLTRINVAVDQKIQRGQVIAVTGNTGRSSGPHLHYEIQVKGHAVNPRSYLWD